MVVPAKVAGTLEEVLSRILSGGAVVVAVVGGVCLLAQRNPQVETIRTHAATAQTHHIGDARRVDEAVEDASGTFLPVTEEPVTTFGAAESGRGANTPQLADDPERVGDETRQLPATPDTTLAPWDPRSYPQAETVDVDDTPELLAQGNTAEPDYAGELTPPEVVLTGSGWGSTSGPVGAVRAGGGLVCPVAGHVSFIDSWGYARSGGRRHAGQDLFAEHGTPLVAVQDAVVTKVDAVDRYRVGSGKGDLGGITIWLVGDDGTAWYYAHMSHIEPGIAVGVRVVAGEKVGAVGNTGNAATTPPHLHIQMHPGGGSAANPYPALKAACG